MKRVLLFLLVIICASNMFGQELYVIKSKTADVMKLPKTNTSVVGHMNQNDIVEVLVISNGWAKINYNGANAYVKTSNIAKLDDTEVEEAPVKEVSAPEETTVTAAATVNNDSSKSVITFDANGGDGEMEPQIIAQGAVAYLHSITFEKDGYKFLYWSKFKDGTGTRYNNNAKISLNGDLTLYANWEEMTDILMHNGTKYMTDEKAYILYDSGGNLKGYSCNEDYRYVFYPPQGKKVKLFMAMFITESGTDYITINGEKFSGHSCAKKTFITGTDEPMIIEFHSDGNETDKGFKANVRSVL